MSLAGCARAASGHDAAAPPSSATNSRRPMPDMGGPSLRDYRTFSLPPRRPEITAHDVAFSLKILKEKGHPIAQQLLRDFVGAEAPDDATVVVRFAAHRARDVPLFVAALPIFSRSYYAARRFDETTLEVPLGSGPYKVGGF